MRLATPVRGRISETLPVTKSQFATLFYKYNVHVYKVSYSAMMPTRSCTPTELLCGFAANYIFKASMNC